MLQKHQSRPLWARELKPFILLVTRVSPSSRPLWARELKLYISGQRAVLRRSRPLWARELKQRSWVLTRTLTPVAPPVGA